MISPTGQALPISRVINQTDSTPRTAATDSIQNIGQPGQQLKETHYTPSSSRYRLVTRPGNLSDSALGSGQAQPVMEPRFYTTKVAYCCRLVTADTFSALTPAVPVEFYPHAHIIFSVFISATSLSATAAVCTGQRDQCLYQPDPATGRQLRSGW